jgi:hypothetical protein
MMSMAFSITGAATADTETELRKSLKKVAEAAHAFRVAIKTVPPLSSDGKSFTGGSPDSPPADQNQLRVALDSVLAMEHLLVRLRTDIGSLIRRKKFRETMAVPNLPFSIGDFRKLLTDLSSYVSMMRRIRLILILDIAHRAAAVGVNVIDTSDEFAAEFLSMPLKETEGWQETAFILANVEGAKRLHESIHSSFEDKTELLGEMIQ